MQKIEIKSSEFEISNLGNPLVLFTKDLEKEIACIFSSTDLKKIALGRNLNREQLELLISNMNIDQKNNILINIKIIGGINCEESKLYLVDLINSLFAIDDNKDFINIESFEVCEHIHRHSFQIDCNTGEVRSF
jgi:hypothetical protein